MVNEASTRDSVAHARCLHGLQTFHEKLQVATNIRVTVDVTRKIEPVGQIVASGLYSGAIQLKFGRNGRQNYFVRNCLPVGLIRSTFEVAVLRNCERTLDDSVVRVSPLLLVIAHQVVSVGMQVGAWKVQASFLGSAENANCQFNYFWCRRACISASLDIDWWRFRIDWDLILPQPVVLQHFHFNFVHAETICVADSVFFKDLEGFSITKVSKLHVEHMLLPIRSHQEALLVPEFYHRS